MDWFALTNPAEIDSPSLIIDADRVVRNIDRMLAIVGGDASRLRPHVKTHKMPNVVKLQLDASITRFKTATIAETEMVADAGAADVLLAHQPVATKIGRLADLAGKYPSTSFATIVDDHAVITKIAAELGDQSNPFRLYIDVDCGMHRTGIPLGAEVDALAKHMAELPGVRLAGLHVYDGHLHQPSIGDRRSSSQQIIGALCEFITSSASLGIEDLEVIGGGSPTFAIWAERTDWQCSPGTPILWDVGYGKNYPDLGFEVAAALLTRVISKPSGGNDREAAGSTSADRRVCLDLGHKSVSSEMSLGDRVVLPAIPDAKWISHSEEHLVVETSQAGGISVGDAFLAFPRHICPSVADYGEAYVVRNDHATGEIWPITARR